MDGNNALAALFAAATASASPKQLKHPTEQTLSSPIRPATVTKATKTLSTKKACPSEETEQAQTMTAANNLIASLINGSLKSSSSSLPPTKTTATFTTTTARPKASGPKRESSAVKKEATIQKLQQAQHQQQPCGSSSSEIATSGIELRKLESWFDEDAEKLDESQYQELADSIETNGWSADEMFRYNEKRHKIMSNFNHRTINQGYTTPLPKNRSKLTNSMAKKLAAEIEQRALTNGGRVTPESSDDDEAFELERRRRIQVKQQKQLDGLKNLCSPSAGSREHCLISNHSQEQSSSRGKTNVSGKQKFQSPIIGSHYPTSSARKTSKPCSQLSESSVTPPATISSTSSSPKPSDSSSAIMNISSQSATSTKSSKRNIFRTSLS